MPLPAYKSAIFAW